VKVLGGDFRDKVVPRSPSGLSRESSSVGGGPPVFSVLFLFLVSIPLRKASGFFLSRHLFFVVMPRRLRF